MRRWLASSSLTLVGLAGCAAMQTDARFGPLLPELAAVPSSLPVPPTTQPAAGPVELDAQQLAGQIVAGVQAELTSRIDATVETALRADLQAVGVMAGYHSNFGVGATLVVSLALLLALVLSHRREMARIRQGWKPEAQR
ncbi:MAG: hypothetical protein IPM13_10290 [Phycisphaerales bacterium]|nr:hypothetical protein [Phycisphaerales bacterium]